MPQRPQRSLACFFASPEDHRKESSVSSYGGPDGMARRSFDVLQEKLFRPQRHGSRNVPAESADSEKGMALDNEFDSVEGLGPLKTLELQHSILGIKRVRDDHDTEPGQGVLNESVLKRKKLLDSLGEGEEQQELWEEAKAKFKWLSPSKIRDGKGRRPGDPLYDSRTLHIPPDALNKMSASQKQYWMTKSEYMDTVLFFKVGKFYELYELDAEIGHKELNWKMTVSGVGKCRQVGVPESGIEDAVCKLVARGYKVGRMEQIETAEQAKAKRGPCAMVQRKLIHVATPSTAMDESMKPEAVHLLALREEPKLDSHGDQRTIFGFAFVDVAAGRFYVGSLSDDDNCAALIALLTQVAPQELLIESGGLSDATLKALKWYSCQGFPSLELSYLQPNVEFLDASTSIKLLESRGYFKMSASKRHNFASTSDRWLKVIQTVNDFNPAIVALGALAQHMHRMKLDATLENGMLALYEVFKGSLRLDGQTLSNLEIFQNNADGRKAGTLYSFLDNCVTPFGKRLLRRWLCHPLQNFEEINDRLDTFEDFRTHLGQVGELRTGLRHLPDLERLISRMHSLSAFVDITGVPLLWNRAQRQKMRVICLLVKGLLSGLDLIQNLGAGDEQDRMHSRIMQSILTLEGINESQSILVAIAAKMNGRFTFLEQQKVKQDKEVEIDDMELMSSIVITLNELMGFLLKLIESLSQIDVFASLAISIDGANGPTCRPVFVPPPNGTDRGAFLAIKELWHPFASDCCTDSIVRNDVVLGCENNSPRALLLTGPNMGGKSTLLRATCLLVIMAQMGCYVPAESCVLSPVDTIFTRLGASDRIMSGESTFMVECLETSSMLQHATENSLVILDELGRGTSTFDGYAIAYAVFRYLVDTMDCRLLFATHYHSLTTEFAAHPRVMLKHMACALQNERGCRMLKPVDGGSLQPLSPQKNLVFLYKLSAGASPDSYGLYVALLAGISKKIVERAEEARYVIKSKLSSSFQSNAHRELFSHVHEQWLRTLLSIQSSITSKSRSFDVDDAYDTLLCIWHELQQSMARWKVRDR